MNRQKKLRQYSNLEILESWINGQKKQCATQFLSLDSDERKDFYTYVCPLFIEHEDYTKILEYVIEYLIQADDYY